jgi:very-short-patch-repair endonuclease
MFDLMLRRLARDQWVRLHGTPRVTVLVGGLHGREIWNQWIALSGMPGTLVEGESEGAGETAPERTFDERIRAAVARAVGEPAHPIAVVVTAEVAARWRSGRRDRIAAMVDEGWIAVPQPPARDARGSQEIRPRGGGEEAAASRDEGGAAEGGVSFDGGDAAEAGVAFDARDVVEDGPGHRELAAARDATPLGGDGPVHPQFYLDARSVAEATLFEALEATPATAGRFRLNESLSVRFGPAAAEVDLLSRADRIAIEIDGLHHFADLVCYRRDRRKDLLLQTQGFVVVRLLAEDVVRDVRSAVTAVHQALAYRLGAGRG